MQTIVLGSSSITRAELLNKFGVPFIQRDAGFDEESLRISDPAHFVYHATKGKMQSYLEKYDLEMPVLCADTVVTAKGQILRKAKDYLFLPFDVKALHDYLQSDAWRGKAGACMVEGFCKSYIKEVVGLESTAMGLSVEKLLPFLPQ